MGDLVWQTTGASEHGDELSLNQTGNGELQKGDKPAGWRYMCMTPLPDMSLILESCLRGHVRPVVSQNCL
jgi:hypothetical protein